MSFDFDTLKVQAGYLADQHNNAVSVPVYQTTAFALGDSFRADRLSSFSENDSIYTAFQSYGGCFGKKTGYPSRRNRGNRISLGHGGGFLSFAECCGERRKNSYNGQAL